MITKKRKIRKRSLGDTLLIIFLFILDILIIGFLALANIRLFQKNLASSRQLSSVSSSLQQLEAKNKQLKSLLFQASQKEYVEKLLREKGMYKKPGEKVVVVLKGNQVQATTSPQKSVRQSSFFETIINFFKKVF